MPAIWKTQQWPQDWKRSVFIPIPKRGNAKECSNYCTAAAKSLQSCTTLWDPRDSSPLGSSVPGILQAGILEWVAIPFFKESSNPGIEPGSPVMQADSLLTEPLGKPYFSILFTCT